MEQRTERRPVRKPVFYKKALELAQGTSLSPYVWVVLTTLINGFLAGVMVAISGAIYLCTDSKYLGAALSSVGYLIVFTYGFSLYTAKVGYATGQNKTQNLMLIPIWFGNLLGGLAAGGMFRLTRISEKMASRGEELCTDKLTDQAGGVLLFAIFCGLLFFLLSDRFKNGANAAEKYITLIGAVMIITLCGFDHSISNVFYLTVAGVWNARAIWYLIITVLGNSLGALLIPLCHLLVRTMRSNYNGYKKSNDKPE